jgi:hypothetical protein
MGTNAGVTVALFCLYMQLVLLQRDIVNTGYVEVVDGLV